MLEREPMKKAFKHPNRNLWYWFRWLPTEIPELDTHFEAVQRGTKYSAIGGGRILENFELPKYEQVRDHYIPDLAMKALNDPGLKGVTPHTRVQKFLLAHDPHTYASEIPLESKELQLSGIVDIIRIVDEPTPVVEILDFKPDGTEKGVEGQLLRYKILLQAVTGLENIRTGWFSEYSFWREKID